MKRFQFQGQGVLLLRRRQRDWAEAQVAKLAAQVAEARKKLCESDSDLMVLARRLDNENSPTASESNLATLSAIGQLHEVRNAYLASLTALQKAQKLAREELRKANARVEALEILKAKQLEMHQETERKRTEAEQGFRTLATWNASQAATPGGTV